MASNERSARPLMNLRQSSAGDQSRLGPTSLSRSIGVQQSGFAELHPSDEMPGVPDPDPRVLEKVNEKKKERAMAARERLAIDHQVTMPPPYRMAEKSNTAVSSEKLRHAAPSPATMKKNSRSLSSNDEASTVSLGSRAPGAFAIFPSASSLDIPPQHHDEFDETEVAQALPVFAAEEDTPSIYASEAVDVEQEKLQEKRRRRRLFVTGFLLALIVSGLGSGLGIGLTRNDSIDTMVPSATPTMSPTFTDEGLLLFLSQLSPDAGAALRDPTSPRFAALSWLRNDTFHPTLSNITIQRYVLALVYLAMGGDTWVNGDGWLTSLGVCDWFTSGSSVCNERGELERLDLNRNNVTGTIPPELSMLRDQLLVLDLSLNRITGTIPTELGRLHRAEVMLLAANQLVGTVPTDLAGLVSVKQLYLDANDLTGTVPDTVCTLTTLKLLWGDCEELACDNCCTRCCTDGAPCNI